MHLILNYKNNQYNIYLDDLFYNNNQNYTYSLCKRYNKFYVVLVAYNGKINNKYNYSYEYLHRKVMGLCKNDKKYVDHIDGNSLNNMKDNLRICTNAENCRNQKIRKDNKTGYKGVYLSKKTNKYIAIISYDYKKYCLGSFNNPIDAAIAYNNKAKELFKEYALLNKVD